MDELKLFPNSPVTPSASLPLSKQSPQRSQQITQISEEQAIHELVMEATKSKTGKAHLLIAQLTLNQDTLFVAAALKIWELRKGIEDKELREAIELHTSYSLEMMGNLMRQATRIGSQAIIDIVGRSLYVEIEHEEPGFWDWLFGRRR